MAARSGIASQFTYAREASYGVYAAPTRALEARSTQVFKRDKGVIESEGLAPGRGIAHGGRRRTTTISAAGSLPFDVMNKGNGLLLQTAMGSAVTPAQQGTSGAYLATHTFSGDPSGYSLTCQGTVPPVDNGTPQTYTAYGAVATGLELTCDAPNAFLAATLDLWATDISDPTDSDARALAPYNGLSGLYPFCGIDVTVYITPAGGTKTAVGGLKKWSWKLDRPLDSETYFNQQNRGVQPVPNALAVVTGSLNGDYLINAVGAGISLASLFSQDTPFALTIELKAQVIGASAYNDTFRINNPLCYLTGDTPDVSGPGVVNSDYPFKTYTNDSGQMPSLETISTESAL